MKHATNITAVGPGEVLEVPTGTQKKDKLSEKWKQLQKDNTSSYEPIPTFQSTHHSG